MVSAPTDEIRPTMAMDGQNIIVAWEDSRRGNHHVGYTQSTDGGESFGPIKFLVSSPVDETRPALGRNGERIVAVWEDPRRGNLNLFSRSSFDEGETWSSLLPVVSAPTFERKPFLAMGGDLVIIAWEDGRGQAPPNRHIAYKRSTDGGDTYGPLRFLVSAPTDEVEPACAVSGALVACIWSDLRAGEPLPVTRESLDGGVTWSGLKWLEDLDKDGFSDKDETNNCVPHSDPGDPTSTPVDTDGDWKCDTLDADDDNDSVPDGSDSDPLNPLVCEDVDQDTCDDCSVVQPPDPNNDGPDSDGDGVCDAGEGS